MGYIYKIVNDVNDKIYIGQTKRTLEERWKEHQKYAVQPDSKSKFYVAIKEIGISHFQIIPIEEVDSFAERNEREKYWINYYNSFENGYNSTRGGGAFEWSLSSAEELKDLVMDMRLDGFSYDEIASYLHCGKGRIADILRENNLLGKNYKTVYNENRIYDLLKEGMYLIDITKQLHCDFKTVQRVLSNHPELDDIYFDIYHPYDADILSMKKQGWTGKRIADTLQCSERTIYRALNRAKKRNINV